MTPAALHIEETDGSGLAPWLDQLGSLRIRVFREYPYLYEGDPAYERDYLATYRKAATCRVVLATTPDGELIGATTCVALAEETDAFRLPFLARGIDPGRVLYFGESVVLPDWRGHGLGTEFFARREAHARRLGLDITAFCAVDRPEEDSRRPAGFQPLDRFWTRLGYTRQPGMQADLGWKEPGGDGETPHTLTFWTRTL